MSNDAPDVEVQSWKPDVGTTEVKTVGGPVWRREPEIALRRTGARRRRTKRLTAFSLLAACSGLLCWVLTWFAVPFFWPNTSYLVLVGADYDDNSAIPLNVYGWNTLDGLAQVAKKTEDLGPWQAGRITYDGPRKLRFGTDWAKPLDGAPGNATLIIYMAVHGGSDEQGGYLIPQDAGVTDAKENRIRLTDVMEALRRLPERRRKVLLLDAAGIEANWQLGMLQNQFARDLNALSDEIEAIPNLVVIGASDQDQRSWASEEWGQTAFGHFVIESFQDDAGGDVDANGLVDAAELHAFVRDEVRGWALSNRLEPQTPILLPAGKVGEQRARGIVMGSVSVSKRPAPSTDAPAFELPPELEKAWTRCKKLGDQVPSPETYSPHQWRAYRDTLIRYEGLLLAGEKATAEEVQRQLSEMEFRMEQARILQLGSLQCSLAMPVVAGRMARPKPGLSDQFNQLWNATPKDYAKVWKQIQGSTTGTELTLLRLQVGQLLIEQFAAGPTGNFEKAYALLQLLESPIHPRPAEIHFVSMLHRDLPQPLTNGKLVDVLQLALRVRLLADQAAFGSSADAYPYTERVSPWIRELIDQADGKRLLGQDLLFSSDPKDWSRSNQFLADSEKIYRSAQDRAAVVRGALATRDRALSLLPYYASWLARRSPPETREGREADDALLKSMETVWSDAHELVALLERPPRQPVAGADKSDPDKAQLEQITRYAQRVAGEYKTIEDQFVQSLQDLSNDNSAALWREADSALAVPYPDPQFRMQLIGYKARIKITSSDQGSDDADRQAQRAKERGLRQGRMALAVLGRDWFDECARGKLENYRNVSRRLENFKVDERWWRSLTIAGHQQAVRWWTIASSINTDMERFDQEPLKTGALGLRDADRLMRQLDGSTTLPANAKNPVDSLRRLQVLRLLLWQAERTWQEHWYSENANAQPYFRVAGLMYTGDAGELVTLPEARKLVSEEAQKLKQSGRIEFVGPQKLTVTSEQRFAAGYHLALAKGAAAPPGLVAISVSAGESVTLLEPSSGGRLARQFGDKPTSSLLTCTMSSPLVEQAETKPPDIPTTKESTLTVDGLFRGQKIRLATTVSLDPVATTIAREYPTPRRGSLAVHSDPNVASDLGAGNAAVAIVLDCSGSMAPLGGAFTPQTKYAEATTALREVLRRLPKGTTVSLWVFGQATGPAKTLRDAEKAIERVLPPTPWDPNDPSQLQQLMAKVSYPAMEPWNESPIVRSMLYAKQDLKQASGFKTLLVITDGMDNRFDKDSVYNPTRKPVSTFLFDSFADSQIEVNIVGFKVIDDEEEAARRQFDVVSKFPVPGQWYSIDRAESLTATLDKAIKQKLRYRLETTHNEPAPGMPSAGLDISRLGQNNQWYPGGLDAGVYELLLRGVVGPKSNVLLGGGDLLLVELTSTGGGLAFRRALFSDQPVFAKRPTAKSAGWRATLLQNELFGDQSIQMLLTLEAFPTGSPNAIGQVRPRQVWMEVNPAAPATGRHAVRWNNQVGYPAPAWNVQSPKWPTLPNVTTPGTPSVRLWWDPFQSAIPSVVLRKGNAFDSYRDLVDRTVRVDADDVTLQSVTIEDHVLEIAPGKQAKVPCLVVRMRYAAGKPVWASLEGVGPQGVEHRFYPEVGAYTGLFWRMPEAEAEGITSLAINSVERFKREATARGYSIDMTGLKSPRTNDVRPDSPVELE